MSSQNQEQISQAESKQFHKKHLKKQGMDNSNIEQGNNDTQHIQFKILVTQKYQSDELDKENNNLEIITLRFIKKIVYN